MGRSVWFGQHKAAIDETLERFMDLVGGKIALQLANEHAKTLAAIGYRTCERRIERTVEKEFAVLGIEAHDVMRQHVDREIRCEARDVLAVTQRDPAGAIARHRASPRALSRAERMAGSNLVKPGHDDMRLST